jgi:signal transduction histidine kinase/CheY-like chemotaxis protein
MRRILRSRFVWLSLGCIGGLALVMGFVLSSLLTRAASEWEWENTAALVRREVRMAGLEDVFTVPGAAAARERWGPKFSRLLTSLPEVVRAKVWDTNARILWSDETHLIGQQFRDNEELREALSGKLEVEIESLRKAEQGYERGTFTTLAEIYVPILSDDGKVVGVVEVYKTPDRLLAAIRRGRIAIWSISFAGALLLFLVMHRLLIHVYREEVEQETLRAETARLEAEVAKRTQQLFQAQKMEAVGLLAGGVAHDFNNLLTVITGRTELLVRRLPPGDPVARGLGLIAETAHRAASLTRQLLAFSRKQRLERRVVSLNSIVTDMEKMLRPLIGEQISLVTVLDPELGLVSGDAGQLEQVILNLVVNARDAMPHGGSVVIRTANSQLDDATGGWRPGPDVGCHAVLSVSDTGIGMDHATQARIFEPFFTTKDPGNGTGLGLSTVYGIVQQHGGFISVESAPGVGTTFRVCLPHVGSALDVTDTSEMSPARAASTRGTETLLVVEDEEQVRALTIDVLKQCGYAVLAAADGEAALRVAARHSGPIHLLLTDVVMPRLNGWDLARQLTETRPETRVLYMTGYDDIAARDGGLDADVLQKPFMPDVLARRVRQAIEYAKVRS